MSKANDTDPETLERKIEATREALGDTVEALVGKADVKAQVSSKLEDGKEQLHHLRENAKVKARDAGEQAKQRPAPVGGIVATLLVVLLVAWLVRRKRQ